MAGTLLHSLPVSISIAPIILSFVTGGFNREQVLTRP